MIQQRLFQQENELIAQQQVLKSGQAQLRQDRVQLNRLMQEHQARFNEAQRMISELPKPVAERARTIIASNKRTAYDKVFTYHPRQDRTVMKLHQHESEKLKDEHLETKKEYPDEEQWKTQKGKYIKQVARTTINVERFEVEDIEKLHRDGIKQTSRVGQHFTVKYELGKFPKAWATEDELKKIPSDSPEQHCIRKMKTMMDMTSQVMTRSKTLKLWGDPVMVATAFHFARHIEPRIQQATGDRNFKFDITLRDDVKVDEIKYAMAKTNQLFQDLMNSDWGNGIEEEAFFQDMVEFHRPSTGFSPV